jgi:hypothetical protein
LTTFEWGKGEIVGSGQRKREGDLGMKEVKGNEKEKKKNGRRKRGLR